MASLDGEVAQSSSDVLLAIDSLSEQERQVFIHQMSKLAGALNDQGVPRMGEACHSVARLAADVCDTRNRQFNEFRRGEIRARRERHGLAAV